MVKKIFKVIGIIFLILILVLILAVGVIFAIDKVQDSQAWDKLIQGKYVNTVSVNGHKMNVCIRGNKEAEYTVVSLQGLNNMANVVEMETATEPLFDKYQFAFVDRAGYGLSEDTHEEQTVEQVVSDYRTALTNAGLKAPYILMGHSFGGVYASYWEMTYPDEIKAVIYIDPTQIGSLDDIKEMTEHRHAGFAMYASVIGSKLGLDKIIFNSKEYTVNLQTDKQKEYAEAIWGLCPMSWTVSSEENNYAENVRKTAELLSPNDIPKLYIDAFAYTIEDIKEKMAYEKKIMEDAGVSSDDMSIPESAIDERFVAEQKDFYERNIKTYIDKLGNVTYVNIPGNHSIFNSVNFLTKSNDIRKAVHKFMCTADFILSSDIPKQALPAIHFQNVFPTGSRSHLHLPFPQICRILPNRCPSSMHPLPRSFPCTALSRLFQALPRLLQIYYREPFRLH